eukprot:1792836-Pyramimonas_sp.AAC.1
MVGRLWSLIREPLVRQWSSDTEACWDAAVRGNPSLREAFARALQQEVPHHLGIAVGEGLVDIKSFYDSIEWPGLVLCSLNLSFPPRILYLELLQCAAARTVSQLGATSRAFQPTRSAVQGLRSGTRFGKAMTHYV